MAYIFPAEETGWAYDEGLEAGTKAKNPYNYKSEILMYCAFNAGQTDSNHD